MWSSELTIIAQKNNPKARAARDAKNVGTKMAESDVGLGAGASAAAAFCTEEMAINATKIATKSFNFIASISLKARRKKLYNSFVGDGFPFGNKGMVEMQWKPMAMG